FAPGSRAMSVHSARAAADSVSHTTARFKADKGHSAGISRSYRDDMPAIFQFGDRRFADSRVHREASKLGFRLAERTSVMSCGEARRREGVLRLHAEIDHLENQLDGGLILEVAARDCDRR